MLAAGALLAPGAGAAADGLRVTIVGGGPAGALAALYFGQSGCSVQVFETRDATAVTRPKNRERSYSNVLFGRAFRALSGAGIDLFCDRHKDITIPIAGSVQHSATPPRASGGFAAGALCVDRGDLAQRLLDSTRGLPNVRIHYSCSLVALDVRGARATFARVGDSDVAPRIVQEFDLLIGADGINSAVRAALQEQVPGFTVRTAADHLVSKTVDFGPVSDLPGYTPGCDWERRVHVWAGRASGASVICAPRLERTATGVVILPRRGAATFARAGADPAALRALLEAQFPTLRLGRTRAEGDALCAALAARRTSLPRVTVYCSALAAGRVALVGDAAHSMSASIGQGVNAALESVRVLAEELGCTGKGDGEPVAPVKAEDVPAAVARYSVRRLPDAVGICAMSHRGLGRTPLQRAVFVAQMMCTAALGKLGLSAPPALALVGRPDISYASIYATELRQRAAAAALIVATLAAAAATAALRSAVPPLALAAALCALSAAAARLRRATRGGARAHSA